MRTIEHVNREIQAARLKSIKWDTLLKTLRKERREMLQKLMDEKV